MCSSTVCGVVFRSQPTMLASIWSIRQPGCPSWSWSPRLAGPLNCEPTKSTRNPPGPCVPSVIESPSGSTRTPPLVSAAAEPVCRAAPARVTRVAATSQRSRVRIASPRLAQVPLLVGLPGAGPELDLGAVGGALTGRVQTQSGLDTGDRPVRVDVPLLVGLAVAVPDDHRRAVGRAPAGGVQALAAVHHELPVGGGGPGLVDLAVAVPQLHLGAVGHADPGD